MKIVKFFSHDITQTFIIITMMMTIRMSMPDINELEQRKAMLQSRADEISDQIRVCSKDSQQNSCGILISERSAISLEISDINHTIRRERRKELS